jgi:hypothetical protein
MIANEFSANVRKKGFSSADNVFPAYDLDLCEQLLSEITTSNSRWVSRFRNKMLTESSTEQQIEVIRPSFLNKQLRNTEVFKRCKNIADSYFGAKTYYLFDHAIYKLPNTSAITPWHQDQAYLGKDIIIPSIHFWIPFQDTSLLNGTMQYVEGSHTQLAEHTSAHPGINAVLKVTNTPIHNIFTMSIKRGGLSAHTNLTIHASTCNTSMETRKAWIIHFGTKPEWYKHILKLKNNLKKHTSNDSTIRK